MPAFGFGTLIPEAAVTKTATRDALEAGFLRCVLPGVVMWARIWDLCPAGRLRRQPAAIGHQQEQRKDAAQTAGGKRADDQR